jgi:hypothetical protein
MENKKNTPKLTLNSEEHDLNGFYISELGFLMMSIGSQSGKRTNYNLGKHDTEQNVFIDLIKKITNKI